MDLPPGQKHCFCWTQLTVTHVAYKLKVNAGLSTKEPKMLRQCNISGAVGDEKGTFGKTWLMKLKIRKTNSRKLQAALFRKSYVCIRALLLLILISPSQKNDYTIKAHNSSFKKRLGRAIQSYHARVCVCLCVHESHCGLLGLRPALSPASCVRSCASSLCWNSATIAQCPPPSSPRAGPLSRPRNDSSLWTATTEAPRKPEVSGMSAISSYCSPAR